MNFDDGARFPAKLCDIYGRYVSNVAGLPRRVLQ